MFHQSLPVDLFILAKQQTINFTNKSMFIALRAHSFKKVLNGKARWFWIAFRAIIVQNFDLAFENLASPIELRKFRVYFLPISVRIFLTTFVTDFCFKYRSAIKRICGLFFLINCQSVSLDGSLHHKHQKVYISLCYPSVAAKLKVFVNCS
jgi:hypothetical protein